MGGECDITAVEAIAYNDHPTQPEMLPLAAILPPVNDGWHKKQRHDQRHHQIDDDYPSEIIQVLLQFLWKEKMTTIDPIVVSIAANRDKKAFRL